jgi:hypothetical protein
MAEINEARRKPKMGRMNPFPPIHVPMVYTDESQLIEFEPRDEPEVLTADLCAAFGGCDKCPGFARVGDI